MNNEVNSKRIRRRNFNEYEKSLIVDIVKDFIHVIENKKTDAVTMQQKEAAWRKIVGRYNPFCETGDRTPLQLQTLYLSLKKKVKKDYASDRAEIYKTGGGSYSLALDVAGEKIISMIKNQFTPVSNLYDSSAALYKKIQEADEVAEESGGESSSNEMADNVVNQPLLTPEEEDVSPQIMFLEDGQLANISSDMLNSTSARKRKNNPSSSLRELTQHVGQRKRIKNDFDQEIHNKRMEILDIELQIKKKQLEQAIIDCESS